MIAGVLVFLAGYAFALLVGAGVKVMLDRQVARIRPTQDTQRTLDEYEDIMVRRNLAQFQQDLYQLHLVTRVEAGRREAAERAAASLADALEANPSSPSQAKAALAYYRELYPQETSS